MIRRSCRLALVALGIPVLAGAQPPAVASGVYRWADLPQTRVGDRIVRRVLAGPTTDLAALLVEATTLPTAAARDSLVASNDAEVLVIVRDGRLRVTMGGATTTVGPGSVVLREPRERVQLASADRGGVTYYVLTYFAKAAPDADRGASHGGSTVVDWNASPPAPTEVGTRRQPLDRPTTMFGRLEMHVSTVNHGLTNHPVHTHRAEEFVLMRHGDVRMVIGDTRQTASVGDLIFLASNVPHSLDNIGDGVAEYFAFQGVP